MLMVIDKLIGDKVCGAILIFFGSDIDRPIGFRSLVGLCAPRRGERRRTAVDI